MEIEKKRVIDLANESTSLAGDEYVMLDSNNTGTTKYRLSRLSDQIEDLNEAVQGEATAREKAVTELEGEITDLKDDLTSLKKSEFDFLMGWRIGDMSGGTYKPLKYRVCSEKVTLSKNICVRANSGYQIYTVRYNADGTVAQSVSFRSAIVCKAGTIVSITIRKSPESTSAEADVKTFAENVYNDRCDTGDYEIYDKGAASGQATNPTSRAITDLISGSIGRISIRSDGYDHYLEQYALDGTQLTDTAWVNGSADYSLDAHKNYKVVFRNTGNTAIDLSDMANNVAVYRIATGMPDILNVNADKISQIQQTFVGRPTLTGSTDSVLSFVWFSDIHKAQKQWDRAVQLGNYYSTKFSFGIHTGDYVGSDQSSYETLYQNGVKSVIPLLNVVGNHDIYTDFANRTQASKSVTKGIVMPDTSDWGVTWGEGDDPMHYYKDFSSQKIRLVVLDDYYDTEAQTTWLATVLDGAKALGYHVLTAAHETSRPITAWSDNTFCSKDAAALTANGRLNHSSSPYDAVIKAFKDGGGVHIAHLCGHEHVDLMGKSANGVLNIVIGSQHGYYADASDAMRISDTVTDDLINVVGINVNLGIIKIVRVGVNTDHYLRSRNVLCYDYINDTTIDNH